MGIDKRDIKRNADRLLEKGLFDRAIREYLRIIEVEPEDLFALQKIAELHSRTGAEASAVSYYERAYKILNTRGFHEKSIGVLKRILELDRRGPSCSMPCQPLQTAVGFAMLRIP